MRRMYEFRCSSCGEITEELTPHETKAVDCPLCGNKAERIISRPRIKDDIMSDNWAKKREQYTRWRAKREEY